MKNEPDLPDNSASNSEAMATQVDIESPVAKRNNSDNLIQRNIINFDAIVKCINEDTLVEYLHDILSFLLSDRSELRFDASGYSELFLLNLLKNEDNLYCKHFNKRCASMSKQIVKVLDNNKDVYKCIRYCENNGSKKVVVFKKEQIPTSQMSCEEGTSPCCGTSNPQSITENLRSDCPLHQNHKVSQDFKMRWLKTTLRFIKDESKLIHEYPDMSPMEATFVYSLITRCKDQKEISTDSYFMPLREAMQIFGLKYFFELTYVHTDRNGKMSLMLEKIPKNIKSIIEGDKRCSNRFRNLKFIKQPKIRTSDETRATRVVSRLKNQDRFKSDTSQLSPPSAADFERHLNESSGIHQNLYVLNTPDLDRVKKQLATKRSRNNKAIGRSGYCDSTDNIDGAGSSRGTQRERSLNSRTNKLIKDMSVPIKSDKAMKMMYGMGWDGGALGARGNGITEPIIPTLDIKAGAGLGHTPTPKTEPKHSNYQQKAGADLSHTASPKNEPKNSNYQQKAGAGLGHTRSHRNERTKTVEIKTHPTDRRHNRVEVFEFLIDMITSDDTVREIMNDKRFTKKEKGFIRHAVNAANERSNMSLCQPKEQMLWNSILEEMNANPDLHIKATVSNDVPKLLILTKEDSPYMSKKKKRKLQKKPSILNIPQLPEGNKKIVTNDFVRQLTDTYVTLYAGSRVSTKAATGVTFRVVILIHLLDVVNSERMETVIEFERILNDIEKDYVENTVVTIVKRKKRGGSKLEHEILTEIKDNLEGFTLRVQFLDDRSFIVHKVDKKLSEKISHDISYTTCSTDDCDKNYFASRCSDDSDAGPDDILGNDDNDGDDERNDSNDISESSKCLEIQQIEEQENLFAHDMSLDDNEEKTQSIEQYEDDKPEDVSKMDIQDFGKETICNDLTNLVENIKKETESNISKPDDFGDFKIDTFKKQTEIITETDMQGLKKPTVYRNTDLPEPNSTTNMQKFEKITVVVSQTDNYSKENKISINMEAVKEDLDASTEFHVLDRDIKNLRNGSENIILLSNDENEEKCCGNESNVDELKCKDDIKVDILNGSISAEKLEPKNTKVNVPKFMKRVYLVPYEYPIKEVDTEFAKTVQILILKEIDVSIELPLLKCHGVQNGALIYSCHNESTFQWLEKLCFANKIKMVIPTNDEIRYKMSLKINSFIDYTSDNLFKMLQLYNKGLAIKKWIELRIEKSCDSLTFIVELDEKSLKYIKESNFSLFAGIDQVQFNPIWN